ncbi:TonB-dependent receptor [Pedobacter ginsengisoli]|uniref:TonB-dependent receptor n=1 Tax=Pedobacter ginsengisoli TaxID=363852 RepID=A0A2D1U118_9SPHI|nr:TonB-dependent receptor [Pedobacter ginsengisoli]ATP55289.1 TonB-dependent receptor [Pedobacter ginsengisoli]
MLIRLLLIFALGFLSIIHAYAQVLTDSIKLKEVSIVDKLKPISRTSISVTLSEKQLQQTKGSDLAETIKEIAGVSILKTGSTISKPVIEGMHGNRILILNNGIRLEAQQWGLEHAPEIDPFLASRIHVIKGAESVRYGAEAIGGVVIVEPPSLPISEGISGTLNLIGALNGRSGATSAMLNGGLKSLPGFGWRLQGTFKRSGNVRSAEYYLGNTGVQEVNYSAAAGYNKGRASYEIYYSRFGTELGILYSAHVGTKEDIDARIAIGRPLENYGFTYNITAPRQKVVHDLLKTKAHYVVNDGQSLDITYGFQKNQRKEYDFRRGDREALPITDLVLNTHTLDLVFEKQNLHGTKRLYGFNGIFQVNNNIPGTLANTFIPNYDSFTGGVFVIQRWLTKDFEFEGGLRYDFKLFDAAGYRYANNSDDNSEITEQYYGGQSRFHNVTGSFGMLWKINEYWQLGSNLGLAWRAPTANELFSNGLHHGAGLYEIGDPNIKTEQGYKWVNSLKYYKEKLNFTFDAYAQYINNYIYSEPDKTFRQTVSGTYPIFRYKQTNASFFGTNFSGTYHFSKVISYKLNASLIRARDVSNSKYLPYIPSDRLDQHIHLNFQFKNLNNIWIQAGHSFVRRQTRYEPESDYAAPPDAYHLFQLSGGTTMKIGAQELGLNLGVDNLFNTPYKEYMNRYRYYTHDMGRNITIRLAYKF